MVHVYTRACKHECMYTFNYSHKNYLDTTAKEQKHLKTVSNRQKKKKKENEMAKRQRKKQGKSKQTKTWKNKLYPGMKYYLTCVIYISHEFLE